MQTRKVEDVNRSWVGDCRLLDVTFGRDPPRMPARSRSLILILPDRRPLVVAVEKGERMLPLRYLITGGPWPPSFTALGEGSSRSGGPPRRGALGL